jgi:hypothetical protein
VKRLKGAEVWYDAGKGVVAIKNVSGDYNVYIDPERVEIEVAGQRQFLHTMPQVANVIVTAKLEILNTLKKKKKK